MPARLQASRVSPAITRIIRDIRLVVFDFDGVFTDNTVTIDEKGRESVRCSRFDGIGLARLQSLGIDAFVLSTETNPVVSARCRKLKLPCIQGCADKLPALQKEARRRKLPPAQIAYVGNDINDAACLDAVGLPIVVADAHPDVIRPARWKTRTPGGRGAVREICDCFHRVLTAS